MIYLSKKCHSKKQLGIIIGSIGAGILIAVLIPLWGWLLAAGGGLIYFGWYLSEHKK